MSYLHVCRSRSLRPASHTEHRHNWSLQAELIGLARATGLELEHIFMQNVRESMVTVAHPFPQLPGGAAAAAHRVPDHCSDVTMWPVLSVWCLVACPSRGWVLVRVSGIPSKQGANPIQPFPQCRPYQAHNEDGAPRNEGNMFLANITIDGGSFWAFGYPGDLLTGAFGWNAHRVGFTLNYVAPYSVDDHGLGRGFISRDLLAATSFDDAVHRATRKYPSATGHNLQIMDFAAGRIANVRWRLGVSCVEGFWFGVCVGVQRPPCLRGAALSGVWRCW